MKRTRRELVRDYTLYFLISLAVVASVIAAALSRVPQNPFMKWFGFVFYTSFVFGLFIEQSRRFWGKKPFWIMTSFLLLAHCAVFAAIASHIKLKDTHAKFFAAFIGETLFFMVCREVFFEKPQPFG